MNSNLCSGTQETSGAAKYMLSFQQAYCRAGETALQFINNQQPFELYFPYPISGSEFLWLSKQGTQEIVDICHRFDRGNRLLQREQGFLMLHIQNRKLLNEMMTCLFPTLYVHPGTKYAQSQLTGAPEFQQVTFTSQEQKGLNGDFSRNSPVQVPGRGKWSRDQGGCQRQRSHLYLHPNGLVCRSALC